VWLIDPFRIQVSLIKKSLNVVFFFLLIKICKFIYYLETSTEEKKVTRIESFRTSTTVNDYRESRKLYDWIYKTKETSDRKGEREREKSSLTHTRVIFW